MMHVPSTTEKIKIGDILICEGHEYKVEIITNDKQVTVRSINFGNLHTSVSLSAFDYYKSGRITNWRKRLGK